MCWVVVAHAFIPTIQEAEAGRSEFKVSLLYRPSSKFQVLCVQRNLISKNKNKQQTKWNKCAGDKYFIVAVGTVMRYIAGASCMAAAVLLTHSAQKVTWKPSPPDPVVIIGSHDEYWLGLIPSKATDWAVTELEGWGALHSSGGNWHCLVRLCTGVLEHFLHTLRPKFSCRCFMNTSCFPHSDRHMTFLPQEIGCNQVAFCGLWNGGKNNPCQRNVQSWQVIRQTPVRVLL